MWRKILFWHSRFLNTSVNLPTSTQDAHINVDICRYRSPTRQIEVTVIDFSFSISFVRFYQYLQFHVSLVVNYHQQSRWGRRLGWLGCVYVRSDEYTDSHCLFHSYVDYNWTGHLRDRRLTMFLPSSKTISTVRANGRANGPARGFWAAGSATGDTPTVECWPVTPNWPPWPRGYSDHFFTPNSWEFGNPIWSSFVDSLIL